MNDDADGDDGRRLDGYTISSPCEPNGSGELITLLVCINTMYSLFSMTIRDCVSKFSSLVRARDKSSLPRAPGVIVIWVLHQLTILIPNGVDWFNQTLSTCN